MANRPSLFLLALALSLFLLAVGGTHPPPCDKWGFASDGQQQEAHWYAGALTTETGTAEEVGARAYVPMDEPHPADLYYATLISVFDSNSSYDQFGFSAYLGRYWLSWSYSVVSGGITQHVFSLSELPLAPGPYWFEMEVAGGLLTYRLYDGDGLNLIWEKSVRTGGEHFVLAPTYFDFYTGETYTGFTVYEEVYQASDVRPGANFYVSDSYYLRSGTRASAGWAPWSSGPVASEVQIVVRGPTIYLRNIKEEVTLPSVLGHYYTNEPVNLTAATRGFVGPTTYSWYIDGVLFTKSDLFQNAYVSFSQPSMHSVSVVARNDFASASSPTLTLEVTKVSFTVSSPYGNVTGSGLFDYGDVVEASLDPVFIPKGEGSRTAFVGWKGEGPGAYDGAEAKFAVRLLGNLTEVAIWRDQCLVQVLSDPPGYEMSVWLDVGHVLLNVTTSWNVTNESRQSLVAWLSDGARRQFNRTGSPTATLELDLPGAKILTLIGVLQYRLQLEGYDGPFSSGSPTGDLWFDEGSTAVVTLPLDYTIGYERLVFQRWASGEPSNTLALPAGPGMKATPIYKTQYMVLVLDSQAGLYWPISGSVYPTGSMFKAAWVDAGGPLPLPPGTYSQTNTSRMVLREVVVGYVEPSSVGPPTWWTSFLFVYNVTNEGSTLDEGNFAAYRVVTNESGSFFEPLIDATGVPPPSVQGGLMYVDRPMVVSYGYVRQFYVSISTPFDSFSGWLDSSPWNVSSFSYLAPENAGPMGLFRFVRWRGTVESRSNNLSLVLNGPYSEEAVYELDIPRFISLVAAAALVLTLALVPILHKHVPEGPLRSWTRTSFRGNPPAHVGHVDVLQRRLGLREGSHAHVPCPEHGEEVGQVFLS